MKPLRILRHGNSDSLEALINLLGEKGVENIKKLKISGSSYRYNSSHCVLNWGCSSRRNLPITVPIINAPEALEVSSCKLKTFRKLSDSEFHNIPIWTTDKRVAKEYAMSGTCIYCRTILRGSQGNGIVIATSEDEVVDAPLYVIKEPVQREYRVHVFDGEIISFAIKKRISSDRAEEEGITINRNIRSHQNGWVFSRDCHLSEDVKNVAINAVAALGLHFGAVDIITTHQKAPVVLEVNSAPGLEGSTLEDYSNAIIKLLSVEE